MPEQHAALERLDAQHVPAVGDLVAVAVREPLDEAMDAEAS